MLIGALVTSLRDPSYFLDEETINGFLMVSFLSINWLFCISSEYKVSQPASSAITVSVARPR